MALHLEARPGNHKERENGRDMDKVAGLKEILEQDPMNALARYGLAMELAGQNQTDAALSEFDRLRADHPDYVAGYFMAAQALARARRSQEAKQRLTDGIACARRTGNQHAQSEMQAMLDDLEMQE
jgi:predicted Zn-dependent protease